MTTPAGVLDWTGGLAEKFPNCSCVELSVGGEEDMYGFTYLASAVARWVHANFTCQTIKKQTIKLHPVTAQVEHQRSRQQRLS
jgi:hypothetical protein